VNRAPQLSDRRRLVILAICCMSLLIVSMDNTIVNVALPSIRRDLHASLSGLRWTVDAYTLALASLLLLSGSTGDRLGRRRTFQAGLLLFVAGSLLCSLAPSLGWLIAARALQAVGGSMLNPVAMSIITNVFTDPRERARAIGAWARSRGSVSASRSARSSATAAVDGRGMHDGERHDAHEPDGRHVAGPAGLREPPRLVVDRRFRRSRARVGGREHRTMGAAHGAALPGEARRRGRFAAAGDRVSDRPTSWLLRTIRYILPAAVTIAGLVVMAIGSEIDLEGGASIVGAGLAIFLLNWLFRVGVAGDRERDAEDAAREYFDRHGRWPD